MIALHNTFKHTLLLLSCLNTVHWTDTSCHYITYNH